MAIMYCVFSEMDSIYEEKLIQVILYQILILFLNNGTWDTSHLFGTLSYYLLSLGDHNL